MKKISKFNFSKKITILISIFFIVSCTSLSPYKVPILQGNIFDEDDIEKVDWIGYKQHFFNAILVPENQIKNVFFSSENLVSSEDKNQIYTKNYFSEYEFDSNGEINENFKLSLHRLHWDSGMLCSSHQSTNCGRSVARSGLHFTH